MSTPTATDRHLALLDELAEIGMVLVRRLRDLPPLPKQDDVRDLEILSRVVRRAILMYHLLEQGRLPDPKPPAAERPISDPSASDHATATGVASDDRTRLDRLDTLDDVSGPFRQVVAEIVHDIQTALSTCHYPLDQEALVQDIVRRQLPPPSDMKPTPPA